MNNILSFKVDSQKLDIDVEVMQVIVKPNGISLNLLATQKIKNPDYEVFSPKPQNINFLLGGVVQGDDEQKKQLEAENEAIAKFMEAMQKMPEFANLMQFTYSKVGLLLNK